MQAIIFDFNRTLFDPNSDSLSEGVLEFLKDYREEYKLALVGGGDEKRKSLVLGLGLQDYFDHVCIQEEKTRKEFSDCMVLFGAKPEKSWVVGDRVVKEIKHGNALGLNTVWFRKGKYGFEEPSNDGEKPNHVVENFEELRKVIPLSAQRTRLK